MNIHHPILNADSYKMGHFLQYPADAKYISSYGEARGTSDPKLTRVMNFGMRVYVRDVLSIQITMRDVEYAKKRVEAHGVPFNYDGWKYIVEEHNGYLPIVIKAIPEGQVVPLGTPLFQVVNTDPMVPWLVSYIETALLRAIWYPTTIASKSLRDRKTIEKYLLETTGSTEGAQFMLHDFGARGVSSNESAAIGGMAHLAAGFMGTDTFVALEYAKEYYGEDMAAFSVIATEHSTTTINGEDGERDFLEKMIDQCPDGAITSCVIDSYNDVRAVSEYIGTHLKDKVIALGDRGSRFVARPDSGDPILVPVQMVEILADKFGTTTNEQGYKVLPDYIRVLKFAASNIVFGMGGGLLQKVNRDTLKFAMKCNAWSRDGKTWIDVFKNPASGKKTSKKGHIFFVNAKGEHQVKPTVGMLTQTADVPYNIFTTIYAYNKRRLTPAYEPKFADVRALADRTY